MSAKDPNMKVIIGADTHDFDKGAKDVKQGLNDLDKIGGQALGSLGNMFGVNTGKIGQMLSAVKGLGAKMTEAGSAGVSAFGKVLAAIGPVGGAIAGLGIGAAVAGFRELQKEADAFKNTVAGANMELATATYIDTYKQILRDFNGDTGKAIAEAESRTKKFWGTLGITIRELFTTGAWQGSYQNPTGGAAMDEYLNRIDAANKGAQQAEDITNEIYKLERRRKEEAVELAQLNADIADKMQIAKDATKSTAEREDAVYKIELMLSQKKAMTVSLEKQLAALYKERSDIASDSVDAADATLAQSARAFEIDRAMTMEETALLKVKNSIGKASDAEIAKMNKLLEQQKKLQGEIDKVRNKWATLAESGAITGAAAAFPGVTGPKMTILPQVDAPYWRETINAQLGEITIGIGFKTDTQKIHDITNEVTNLLQSSVARTGEIIGNLIGTLAGGGDAWGDFKNAALSAFGDMAIAIGKIAISAGLASSGIAAALKNPENWMLAVAAGAALVALGSAVKSSLSAVSSGDYSAGGGGYSGGYASGGSSDFETREVQVYVTGTLEADGDKLITVINNTNKKNYYTQ